LVRGGRALRKELREDDDAAEDHGELEELERDLFKLQIDRSVRESVDRIAMTKQGAPPPPPPCQPQIPTHVPGLPAAASTLPLVNAHSRRNAPIGALWSGVWHWHRLVILGVFVFCLMCVRCRGRSQSWRCCA
jgi:hypothetical protein